MRGGSQGDAHTGGIRGFIASASLKPIKTRCKNTGKWSIRGFIASASLKPGLNVPKWDMIYSIRGFIASASLKLVI